MVCVTPSDSNKSKKKIIEFLTMSSIKRGALP